MNPGLVNVWLIEPPPLHRIASTLDGEASATIVPRNAWKDVLARQASLPPEQRGDLVYVPDLASASAFAAAGFNILCEPLAAASSEEAEELVRVVKASGVVAGVAYASTGYPMVRQAAEMVREKKVGTVHKVLVMAQHSPTSSPLDTLRCLGPAAESLIATMTGLRVRSLCACIASNPGEKGTDHVNLMLQLDRPAKGSVWLSQVNTAAEFMQITVLGDQGVLQWRSDESGHLWYTPRDQASRRLCRGGPELGAMAREATRFPAAHPEGASEALANIYRGVYEAIRAKREGRARKGLGREFPTVQDAPRTARFIEAAQESDRAGSTWVQL